MGISTQPPPSPGELLSTSQPRAIPPRSAARGELGPVINGTAATVNGDGGPLTPRNNVGPFVLDGAAGRPRDARDARSDGRARSRTPLAGSDVTGDNEGS
jgi:hypothetical protein